MKNLAIAFIFDTKILIFGVITTKDVFFAFVQDDLPAWLQVSGILRVSYQLQCLDKLLKGCDVHLATRILLSVFMVSIEAQAHR